MDLARRHSAFEWVSPRVGELDADALDATLRSNPGGAVELLADLTRATDESLRVQARRLAGKIMLERSRTGPPRTTGTARLRHVPADRGGELDIDASLDRVVQARAARRPLGLDELLACEWGRPDIAVCLLVDASGSMTGGRLAAAALTAAACAWRAPHEFAVLSFDRSPTTHRSLHEHAAPGALVDTLLALRGHGVTGLAMALRAASDQLSAARSSRRITVLLSDCRATDDLDPLPAALAQDELLVLAPADDADDARRLAAAANGRCSVMSDAADAPAALARLLDPR